VGILCRLGTKFVDATPRQLAALQDAVEPVRDAIARGPGNEAALARIEALKGSGQPDRVFCPAAAPAKRPAAPPAAALEGTFRTSFSERELESSPRLMDQGELNGENWGELTLRFSHGQVVLSQRNKYTSTEVVGTYTTDGDALTLDIPERGETWAFRWTLYRDTLTFKRDTALGPGPTPWLVKPFKKVR
jgi:hypothetical protein